jgi:hypothetical protein
MLFIYVSSGLIKLVVSMQKVQLDKNAALRACHKDRQYIEKLEAELRNCYQEIGMY